MSAPNSHRSPLISCSPRLPAESATYHCLVLEGTTLSDGDEEADEGEVDSLSGVGRTQPPRAAAASLSVDRGLCVRQPRPPCPLTAASMSGSRGLPVR